MLARSMLAAVCAAALGASVLAKPINPACPIMENPVNPNTPTVTWMGHEIGFCCPGCDVPFLDWPDEKKAEYVMQYLEPVNNICPVSGDAIPSDAPAVFHNGFKVALCCEGCTDGFTRRSAREKDRFIARFVERANDACPVTGNALPDNPPIETWNARVVGFCCPMCPGRWRAMGDEQKQEALAKVLRTED